MVFCLWSLMVQQCITLLWAWNCSYNSSLITVWGAGMVQCWDHSPSTGLIPKLASCGLRFLLLLVLALAPWGFSPSTPVFPSPQKPTFPNSSSIRRVSQCLNKSDFINAVFVNSHKGCPCSCWERHTCWSRKSMGGEDVLLLPGYTLSLFSHGVSSRWWVMNKIFLILSSYLILCYY